MNQPLQASELFEVCEEESIYIPGVPKEKLHEEKHSNTAIGKLMKRVFSDKDSAEVDVFTITIATQKVSATGSTIHYPAFFYTVCVRRSAS